MTDTLTNPQAATVDAVVLEKKRIRLRESQRCWKTTLWKYAGHFSTKKSPDIKYAFFVSSKEQSHQLCVLCSNTKGQHTWEFFHPAVAHTPKTEKSEKNVKQTTYVGF